MGTPSLLGSVGWAFGVRCFFCPAAAAAADFGSLRGREEVLPVHRKRPFLGCAALGTPRPLPLHKVPAGEACKLVCVYILGCMGPAVCAGVEIGGEALVSSRKCGWKSKERAVRRICLESKKEEYVKSEQVNVQARPPLAPQSTRT